MFPFREFMGVGNNVPSLRKELLREGCPMRYQRETGPLRHCAYTIPFQAGIRNSENRFSPPFLPVTLR